MAILSALDRVAKLMTGALLLLGGVLGGAAALAVPTPAQVEAAFLFNFSQFVDWPPAAFADAHSPIVIGVLGNDPFGPALEEVIRGEVVNGRTLAVRRFRDVEEVSGCHILFVSRSEGPRLEQILQALKGRSVLTVSELEGFALAGGVIRFVLTENRIRLRINLEAARAGGLTLSSKLLRPAQIVGPGEG
jgi:hypothetical protein